MRSRRIRVSAPGNLQLFKNCFDDYTSMKRFLLDDLNIWIQLCVDECWDYMYGSKT